MHSIILWIILFLLFGIVIVTCRHIPDDHVMTVNGPKPAGKMGVTLEHEHILVDFRGAASPGHEAFACISPGRLA